MKLVQYTGRTRKPHQASLAEHNQTSACSTATGKHDWNVINRARSSPATAIPVQTQTVTPPAAPSEGGMNTPVDLNDFQSNQQQQRQRGGVVTAAARTMGPNRSVAPRLS